MIFSQVFRADKPFLLTIHVQKCLEIKIDQRENGLDTYLGSNTIYLSYTNIYLILICKNKGSTSFNSILSVYQSIQMRIQWHLFTCSKYSKTFMVTDTQIYSMKISTFAFNKINAQTLAVSHVTLDLYNKPLMKAAAYIKKSVRNTSGIFQVSCEWY